MEIEGRSNRRIHAKETPSNERQLAELLEIRDEDTSALSAAIDSLREAIAESPRVGRILAQNQAGRNEFVIPIVSAEQKEKLLDALYELAIFPWEENGLIVIERAKDLKKLTLAGLVEQQQWKADKSPESYREEKNDVPRLHAYSFPLPAVAGEVVSKPAQSPRIAKAVPARTEEPGADTDLLKLIDDFDAGMVDDDDPGFVNALGPLPTLSLFPHVYIWKQGRVYRNHSGEEITQEERQELLRAAHDGDQKAKDEYVRMNIGLVLTKLARVRKKFPGNPDDLFQAGLMGLMRAIELYDPNTENAGTFSSYASLTVENRMRREAFLDKPIHLPVHTSRTMFRIHSDQEKLDKRARILGPDHAEEQRTAQPYRMNERLRRILLIGAQFNPIQDEFADNPGPNLHDVDWNGNSLFSNNGQNIEAKDVARTLQGYVSSLPTRQRIVIAARFGMTEGILVNPADLESLSRAGSVAQERMRYFRYHPQGEPESNLIPTPMEQFVLSLAGLTDEPIIQYEFTLEELTDVIGATRERGRQIEATALRAIKTMYYRNKGVSSRKAKAAALETTSTDLE